MKGLVAYELHMNCGWFMLWGALAYAILRTRHRRENLCSMIIIHYPCDSCPICETIFSLSLRTGYRQRVFFCFFAFIPDSISTCFLFSLLFCFLSVGVALFCLAQYSHTGTGRTMSGYVQALGKKP